MMQTHSLVTRARVLAPPPRANMKRALTKISTLLLLVFCAAAGTASAQSSKLPPPDRVVGDYLKAVGGKKRVASVRDATYEWAVLREGAEAGTARTQLKTTGALRTDFLLADGEWDAAANLRTAWLRARRGVEAVEKEEEQKRSRQQHSHLQARGRRVRARQWGRLHHGF